MALNNIIRRVSSPKVVPLAFRKAGRSQRYHHHCSAVLSSAFNRGRNLCSGNIFKHVLPSTLHRYSTKSVHDESLIQILNDKIKSFEGTEAEEDFPFKIVDIHHNMVKLTREYQGETVGVTVYIYMPSPETEDEDEDEAEDEHEDEDGHDIEPASLSVKVSKKNGPEILELNCTALDEIYIDSIGFYSNGLYSEVPDTFYSLGDLDEKLLKAFHKYLETRGVKPSIVNNIRDEEYMDKRNTLLSVEKIKKFIEKEAFQRPEIHTT